MKRWWILLSLLICLACANPVTPTPPLEPYEPPPVVVEPPPPPPPAHPLAQRGDFLTFYCSGYDEGPYYLGDYRNPDPRCVKEYEDRGYTDIWLSVSIDNFVARHDLLAKPAEFRAWVPKLGNLRVTPMISCYLPDDECEERNNYPGRSKWPQMVQDFARQVDDLVHAYAFGVEVWEWTSQPTLVEAVTKLRQVSDKPIIIHFNQDDPGNDGLWRAILPLGGQFGMSFQYLHAHGRPFATEMTEIERRTPQLVAWAKQRGIFFIAGEYAFEVPEEHARTLGKRALELGAGGCWNGC